MFKKILSPFKCCVTPPSDPKPEPDPILQPNPNPNPIPQADVAAPEPEPEEEIDPIAMLAAIQAAPRRRVFQSSYEPFPHFRPFKPTLEPIIEDPEAEIEAERAWLAVLNAEQEAERAELAQLKIEKEAQAQAKRSELEKWMDDALRAELDEKNDAQKVESEVKTRNNNWMKRLLKKCKRGREERETRAVNYRIL